MEDEYFTEYTTASETLNDTSTLEKKYQKALEGILININILNSQAKSAMKEDDWFPGDIEEYVNLADKLIKIHNKLATFAQSTTEQEVQPINEAENPVADIRDKILEQMTIVQKVISTTQFSYCHDKKPYFEMLESLGRTYKSLT